MGSEKLRCASAVLEDISLLIVLRDYFEAVLYYISS